MQKEEILEKSRQSRQDEGVEYAENQGHKIGYIVFVALFGFLAVFSWFFWQIGTFQAVSSLFWANLAAETYGRFRFLKKKADLITALCSAAASVGFLVAFVLTTLGK